MDSSFYFDTIHLGWSIVYIEGSQVIISNQIVFLSLKIVIVFANIVYSKTCLKRPLKKKTKIGFQDRLSLNASQKYCRMQYFRPSLS